MRGDHPTLAAPPRRVSAIRFAERYAAVNMAAALANPRKFGVVIFEALRKDRLPVTTVVSALHSAKNCDWANSTFFYGDVCYRTGAEQRKLLELIPLLQPEQACWACITVLPEYAQTERQLLMKRLRWWEAWKLLTYWEGKWAPDEVKLLHKIADGG